MCLILQTLANISISTIGAAIAGENYSLVCTIVSIDPQNITWLDSMNNTITSGPEVLTNGSTSTLTVAFNPLAASHAGTYTCQATVGNMTEAMEVDVSVESE